MNRLRTTHASARVVALALLVFTALPACGLIIGGTIAAVDSTNGTTNTAPAATILAPITNAPLNDRIEIRYLLIDVESNTVDIAVTYQINGGPFFTATPVADFGHEGTAALSSEPGGIEHLFVWNSAFDLGDADHVDVRVRIAPIDDAGAAGAEETSVSFPVLNRRIATFAGGEVRGNLLIGPSGLWLDEDEGVLYVADDLGSKVQRIDLATLAVTRTAGNDLKGYDEDDVLASSTSLDDPSSVLRLGDTLYVGVAFRIRAIRTNTGFIKTAIGTGVEESSGDGGFPENAGIVDQVFGLAHDSRGNIYFTEESDLRVWNRQPTPFTVAGIEVAPGTIETIGRNGDEPEAWQRLLIDDQDRVFVTSPEGLFVLNTGSEDFTLYAGSTLPATVPPGEVGRILGTDDGTDDDGEHALLTEFNLEECNIAFHATEPRYFLSAEDHRIREIDTNSGIVRILAGTGDAQNDGDGGPARLASIHQPRDIALSRDGMLFLACASSVRAINVSAIALPLGPTLVQPGDIATVAINDPGDFLVADDCLAVAQDDSVYTMDSTSKSLIQVDPVTRRRTVVVGAGGAYGGDGGPAVDASAPGYTVVIDADGNLFIGSSGRIRVVNRQTMPIVVAGITIQPGHIDTIAGNGDEEPSGDGGPALDATFTGPEQLALDGQGGVYFVDVGRVRVLNIGVTPLTVSGIEVAPGCIETLVGNGDAEECAGDGGPALDASCAPIGVSLDAAGNIYLVDESCGGVRVVNVTASELVFFQNGDTLRVAPGTIETLVGTGDAGRFTADGLPALGTRLTNPRATLVHPTGLLICDAGSRRLRRVDLDTGLVTTVVGTGEPGFNGNAIPLENVRVAPELVEIDSAGRIYVLDGSGRIRRFLLSGP